MPASLSTPDRRDIAALILLAFLALTATSAMAWFVTERIPHLEDEMTYLFQARTYAEGALWVPAPSGPFFTPFVVDVDGRWIGKYPVGWPAVLAQGERWGLGWLVNPLLATLTILLIYLLSRDLFDRQVGLLAGLLALSSPFFLIQSSSYMSHSAALLWVTAMTWAFVHAEGLRREGQTGQWWAALAGLMLGMLAMTRSLTAIGIVLPFLGWLALEALRQPRQIPAIVATYVPMGLITILVAAVQPLYLTIVTGSPNTNLYTMIWEYDRIGFGPDIGRSGHTLEQALTTAGLDLGLWASELFGLPHTSWLILLVGLVALWRRSSNVERLQHVSLLVLPFITLVGVHLAYWVGAQVYGPRYYYEAHSSLAIIGALGLVGLGQLLAKVIQRVRPMEEAARERLRAALPFVLCGLVLLVNLTTYLPGRLDDWHGLYGIVRAPIDQLETLRQSDELLVLVRGGRWFQYAALFSLNSPWFDGEVIVAHDNDPRRTAALRALLLDRETWFYSEGQFTREPAPYN
ncbi:MAG: phospholipid carrier-dependent glycosyltransferase [Chloroflexi bacterium]|nr:phospholipid carrier-dependent glycosyltransferase [Chloroflexota bacterium]